MTDDEFCAWVNDSNGSYDVESRSAKDAIVHGLIKAHLIDDGYCVEALESIADVVLAEITMSAVVCKMVDMP